MYHFGYGLNAQIVRNRVAEHSGDARFAVDSPDGFEWGYGGSGPAQLALAILADYFGCQPMTTEQAEHLAIEHHQQFKAQVVAAFDREVWEITTSQIIQALTQ